MGGKTQLQLEKEDKERDAAFNKAMHGKTSAQANGVATILFKNPEAKQAALDAYFKHFDNKKADNETDADRKVCLQASPRRLGGPTASSLPLFTSWADQRSHHRHEPTSTPH
jgi:hypothetical protein